MVDFNASDVKKVAQALLENWYYSNDSGRNAYFECNHCAGFVNQWKHQPDDIKHDTDCAVLIAKDLLTGL